MHTARGRRVRRREDEDDGEDDDDDDDDGGSGRGIGTVPGEESMTYSSISIFGAYFG